MVDVVNKFGINWKCGKAKTNNLFLVDDENSYNTSKMWFMLVLDKNDNTQYLGQLIVVEDTMQSEEERENLYSKLKETILPQSNANEVFVESIKYFAEGSSRFTTPNDGIVSFSPAISFM